MPWNTNTDAVLSAIRVATHENTEKGGTGDENGSDGGEDDEDDDEYTAVANSKHDVKPSFDGGVDELGDFFFVAY